MFTLFSFVLLHCITKMVLEQRLNNRKSSKTLFPMFTGTRTVNMKTVMEPLRNSKETVSTLNLIVFANFQYWPRFLVSYKNTCIDCQISQQ